MEKGIGAGEGMDLVSCMEEMFQSEQKPTESYSPLALAFIGDSVYDLIIKTLIVNEGNRQVQKLHLATSALVQASAQSCMMRYLQPLLTPEELTVFKRGRNAKSVSPAKNQSLTDYRRATGFEALMGYLYLEKQWERMMELIQVGVAAVRQGTEVIKDGESGEEHD